MYKIAALILSYMPLVPQLRLELSGSRVTAGPSALDLRVIGTRSRFCPSVSRVSDGRSTIELIELGPLNPDRTGALRASTGCSTS
jgi:hypothetical protein